MRIARYELGSDVNILLLPADSKLLTVYDDGEQLTLLVLETSSTHKEQVWIHVRNERADGANIRQCAILHCVGPRAYIVTYLLSKVT